MSTSHGPRAAVSPQSPSWSARVVLTLLVVFLAALPGARRASGATAVAMTTPPVLAARPGERFRRLVATADDLYILDDERNQVRRYQMHGLPYAEMFIQVMRANESADGVLIGRPLDLVLDRSRLFVLDTLGSLWRYQGAAYARAITPLRLQSNQGTRLAVAMRGDMLVLLDAMKRQIWLYARAGAGYDTRPRPLFPVGLGALTTATRIVAMPGGMLVLRSDGSVLRIPWHTRSRTDVTVLTVRATGLCALPSAPDAYLVATSDGVSAWRWNGTALWHVSVPGIGGDAISDVAADPRGRIYVLTPTRILRVGRTAM